MVLELAKNKRGQRRFAGSRRPCEEHCPGLCFAQKPGYRVYLVGSRQRRAHIDRGRRRGLDAICKIGWLLQENPRSNTCATEKKMSMAVLNDSVTRNESQENWL